MAKRVYSKKYKNIFRYSATGSWFTKRAGKEYSLETNDEKQAEKNRQFLEKSLSFFGAQAHSNKVKNLLPHYFKEREDQVKRGQIKEGTYRESRKVWKSLEAFFGGDNIASINQKKWDSYCENSNASDFQNHRNAMSHFLNWCVQKDFILAARKLKNPKHKRRKQKIIEPNHLVLMFQHADGNLRSFLTLALFTGMRRSEIMKLTWQRVNFEKRTITLRDEDVKTNEGREIPFNKQVCEELTLRLKRQQDRHIRSKFVFPNTIDPKRHMDVGGLKTAWKTLLKRAGLTDCGYHWHNFRATFEKYMHLAQGFTKTQIEKMAGASIDVQRRIYVSMTADDLRGLEDVVQVPELTNVLRSGGKRVGKSEP